MRYGLLITLLLGALASAAPAYAGNCGCKECKVEAVCDCAVPCAEAPKRCEDAKLSPDVPQEGAWIIDPDCCPRAEFTLCCARDDFRLLGQMACKEEKKEKCSCKEPKSCDCR